MSEIVIKNLTCGYSRKVDSPNILENLNCVFLDNTFCVLLGSNGSGKTTLIKTILGFVPHKGDIFVDGVDLDTIDCKKRNIGYVSQQFSLYPHYTVFDNLAFPLKQLKLSREEIIKRVKNIAHDLDLSLYLSRLPKQLSLGQQQRVCIGRAIIKNPSICLLDEPFSNLDPILREKERKLIKNIAQKYKITTIYITHDYNEAILLADKVYVLDDKHIIFSGDVEEFKKSNIYHINK